ncbi:MAG: NUDIX hydrolase [Chloroflexi bacterium]|nr:NUDIX hydrolase [Chloroflexota bacterium]
MSATLVNFLHGKTAVSQAAPTWAWQNQPVPLRQQTYICPTLPPDELISSSRAILFHGENVMVIRDHKNEPYIMPGGRRESGETVLQTLQREVREETGWEVRNTAVIGFVHFHHLGLKPPNYPYPYPDFVHAIFLAWADSFDETGKEEDYYVTSSSFQPVADVLTWQLHGGQNQLLQIAIKQNMPNL